MGTAVGHWPVRAPQKTSKISLQRRLHKRETLSNSITKPLVPSMSRFAPQIKIPATHMRGGTSKGVFFKLQDLPEAAQQPGPARDALLLRV